MDSNEKPTYRLIYKPGWDEYFVRMDKVDQEAILKKIDKQQYETHVRHLKKGTEFSVLEVGQNRITLVINEHEKIKEIWFVGNHKQYERWYTRNIAFHDEGFTSQNAGYAIGVSSISR